MNERRDNEFPIPRLGYKKRLPYVCTGKTCPFETVRFNIN